MDEVGDGDGLLLMLTVLPGTCKMVSYRCHSRSRRRTSHITQPTDFPCTGRFGLLVLTSTDLLDYKGTSAKALNDMDSLFASYPPTLL